MGDESVPLRMEIVLKDIESNKVVLVRRDTGEKLDYDSRCCKTNPDSS